MPDITVHFDISGSIEDCSAFMALIGFPISTSMTDAEQTAKAAGLNATATRLESIEAQLAALGKPPATT